LFNHFGAPLELDLVGLVRVGYSNYELTPNGPLTTSILARSSIKQLLPLTTTNSNYRCYETKYVIFEYNDALMSSNLLLQCIRFRIYSFGSQQICSHSNLLPEVHDRWMMQAIPKNDYLTMSTYINFTFITHLSLSLL